MNQQTEQDKGLDQQKEPVIPSPPPKSKLPLFLILGLVVVVVLVGGYKLINNSSAPSPQLQQISQTPDSTSNWKSYENDVYNFSFRYPSSLIIEEVGHFQEPGEVSNGISVILNRNKENAFMIQAQNNYSSTDKLLHDTRFKGERTIAGKVWEVFIDTYYIVDGGSESGTRTDYKLQLENNNILYTVYFSGQENLTTLQDQILSTFKFLE